jgi:O-antigen/teichoic acid export membrane protein
MSVITAFGRFRTASACAFLNLVVYSTCGFILIPRYGALGAAWSTLATEGINMLVQLTIVVSLLRRRPALAVA